MVSTRHHPRPFPEPASPSPRAASTASSSPTKASSQPEPAANANDSLSTSMIKSSSTRSTARTPRSRKSMAASSSSARLSLGGIYTHVIDPIIMVWMIVSLPLVIWDTGYVLMRPYTMPGGFLHYPVWSPYALYGTIDYVYGWPAYDNHDGFTSAQGALNLIETLMYLYYVAIVVGLLGSTGSIDVLKFWEKKYWVKGEGQTIVKGNLVATGVLFAFSSAVMTLSKTVLYWANEGFSGFSHIGHNSWMTLLWLWVVPNGLWLVFPTYMIYVLGKEIIAAMEGRTKEE